MYPLRLTVSISITLILVVAGCSRPEPQSTRVPLADQPPSSIVPIESTTAVVNKHPPDAVAFGGHWYKAYDKKVSWHEAKKNCEDMGGYLACIESAEEQAFIAKLANGRYLYLGGTDEQHEDTWVWSNSSKWDYTHWMEGQPNNYGGNEHYLATYDDGVWVDVAADGDGFWMPTGYICEWEN